MESVLGRYRNLTILVGVLFLQVLGLAVQVKRSGDAENTRLIRIWAVGAITPFERGLVWVHDGSRNLWHNYFFLRGVRAENRELKAQIEQMRLEQVRLSEDAAQAHRLQQLLAFKEQYIAKTVAAQVIGSSGSDLSRSIYIDKGSNEGIGADMAVITTGGIVGKVLRVYPSTSLVLMINDQSSGVGAMLEKSRLQGVLRGTANGEVVLERVMSDEQVVAGETVLSSGGDQIFPKGLPVGTVSNVSPGRELFLNIQVKPAADLSRLEEVLVVTQKQERQVVTESPAKVRAADILAQRLPSIPDKPADAGTAKPGSSGANTTVQGSNGGAKPPTGVVPKPQTENATGAAAKMSPTTPTVSSAGAVDAAHKSTDNAPVAAGETSKKVLAKAPSDSTPIGNSRSAAQTNIPLGASSSDMKPSVAATNSAVSTAKPQAPQSKPASGQPLPQPPAADDNPH
ncbi:MAG: rod shape-determining protein MreC [Candidatus Sulfotelmatobacter sp.]